MNSRHNSSTFSIIAAFVTALFFSLPSNALADVDYESFRQELIQFIETYGTNVNQEKSDSELIADIQLMSLEELQEYRSLLTNPSIFANSMIYANSFHALQREVKSKANLDQSLLRVPRSHPNSTGFPPDYPSGANYDTFIATLPGLGILDFGKTNRTDANAVGGTWIAFEALDITGIIAQAACDASLLFAPIACPLAQIAILAARASQVVLEQADYQDALIDGAEIEAAFENTKILIAQENGLNTDLANHNTAISSQIAVHDVNIISNLAAHDANIAAKLAAHDAKIAAQLAAHDTDVKALLANLQGAVDENQRLIKVFMGRQLEVMRLLITPNGQREIDPLVLSCTGDDCPAVLVCPNGDLSWPCK